MNEEILTLYEAYFRNADNHKIFIQDLQCHHCCFCEDTTLKVKHCSKYSKTDMTKIILEYLNHLKLISCPSWEKVKYFFRSIRISGFLADDCVGKWMMIKWLEKDIYILCRIE